MPSVRRVDYALETCYPCKFFQRKLWKSGRDPIYHSSCVHPSVTHGEAVHLGVSGRYIGKEEENETRRPDWCPIRNNPELEREASEND